MKKKALVILIIVVFFSIIYFLVIKNNNNVERTTQKLEPYNLDKINIPIFPELNKVQSFRSNNGKYYEIMFTIKLPYPSKKVLEFYKNELKKEDYEQHIPESYQDKNTISDWQLGYSSPESINPYHAQLDAFWLNKKNRKILWLVLFYEWKNNNNPNIKLEENSNQYGILYMAKLDDKEHLETIDINKYFSDQIFKK